MGERTSARRLIGSILIVAAIALVVLPSAEARRGGSGEPTVCGLLPGEGAFSYVKAWNVSCRRARKVANEAHRRLCKSRPDGCAVAPLGGYVRGEVAVRGWECRLTIGYEYRRVRCERGEKRFVSEFGA